MPTNKQIHLDNRPAGEASASNFKLVTAETPALQDGQVLVRHHFMSLDPYMRGRMNDSKSYAAPQPLGQVMQGGTVGEVVESKSDKYKVGDKVVGFGGWQEYSVVNADQVGALRKVDTTHVPLSHYLGAVGMPGVTAWYGLVKIIQPKAGQTVVVSAASGAVGSAFGALAKARDLRVVGIAGGEDKCKYVTDDLGFDACIDYKAHRDVGALSKALKAACLDGISGYFENVGGVVMDAVMTRMNAFGRIALCGMIAGYDGKPVPMSFPQLLLTNRMTLEGFIVSEHMEVWPEALTELGMLVGTGKLRPRESVAQGIEAAPEAFLGLLKGRNFGKQLVKLI
ncbi:zinc-binding dehydrogenase [Caenimonas koreensis DSM 17982]|uniref:Zinc-binding dehydrogenase n=1 Tax=Caenimonas koreensis DSM 17982 TaxID=1121255 RepID=A0A844AVL0_9BURK|nr:NADP-dependent oxidoreductase [Caenimonas koreensis]MRD48550.1 zinc-binding dehydrogenase [Caenimonas koreensis DSM 17982]